MIKTIESLQKQTKKPEVILIADGGSPKNFQEYLKNEIKKYKNVEFVILPGRCVDTRRKVIDKIIDETEIVVFIDADEVAPEDWLKKLIEPIEKREADYTGGTLRPYDKPKSKPEYIMNIIQAINEKVVSQDITYLAMGNSAWHVRIFKKIGSFDSTSLKSKDVTISRKHYVSEDFDINIREGNAGFKGKFIPDAFVYHDQSHVCTYRKLIRHFYGNYVRTAMVYFKHKRTALKFTKGTIKTSIKHPIQIFLIMLKPIALIVGWKEWKKNVRIERK